MRDKKSKKKNWMETAIKKTKMNELVQKKSEKKKNQKTHAQMKKKSRVKGENS
jgi:hypothetical protein